MDQSILAGFQELVSKSEVQQIRTQLSTNIVTIVGVALVYGVLQLLGEYLTTFIFTFIFAIALTSIKKTLLHKVLDIVEDEGDELFTYSMFRLLHTAKFSLLFRLLFLLYNHLTSFERLFITLKMVVKKTFDATIVPYLFLLYVLCFKLHLHMHLLIIDLLIWVAIDIFRGLRWLLWRVRDLLLGPKEQPLKEKQMSPRERLVHIIKGLEQSSTFNNLLFMVLVLTIVVLVPLSFFLCYNNIMQYKQVITPNLAKMNLYNQLGDYLKPEYMLKYIEGSYISPETAAQFYQYFENTQQQVDLLSVFWDPDHYEKMKTMLDACSTTFCRVRLFASNYGHLNTEFNEILQNGLKQFQSVLPQIQEGLKFVAAILFQALEGSMGYIFKFMLFYSGVLYMMNESSWRVQDLIIFNVGRTFKKSLSENINNHITGVFVSLTQIFIYHFMLSFLLLDTSGIQLSFIVSVMVAFFSLNQIVSPSVFYLLIIGLWHLIGTQVTSASFMWASAAIFFYWSGAIYETCFAQHLGNSYWIALSVILGYISFQWKGIVYGPLLVGLVRTLKDIIQVYLKEMGLSQIQPSQKAQPETHHVLKHQVTESVSNLIRKKGKNKQD